MWHVGASACTYTSPPSAITCRWRYETEEDLDGTNHWGLISTYAGGGFVQNLATRRADALEIIDEMKQNLWLDRGTRAVFIDFTVYNANINLFCVIRSVAAAAAVA